MKRALLAALAALILPTPALAEGGDKASLDPTPPLDPMPPSTVHVVDDVEPKLPLVPRAPDLLGSHVLLGAAVGPTWSRTRLGTEVSGTDAFGTGIVGRVDAGYGVSRSVALGVWGAFGSYGDGTSCSSCNGKMLAVGPFVRYHLLQGLRFDPWFTLGAGYRQARFDSAGTKQSFSGLEWLHFELGADYYAFSGFGFGPYGSLGLSTYTQRPSNAGDATVNAELSCGLRFFLDLPGR